MQKFITILLILVFVFLSFLAKPALAVEDPLAVPNNRFGIHILDENDLWDAASLVNSSGGDWGYVTIVIQENDKDSTKWQRIFDRMGALHLIPIVRIAATPQRQIWQKLLPSDIDNWIFFLGNLSWPTKNRYVVIGNEPNHAKEWGGKVDPGEYALYLREISSRLKENSPDFFILPAGLDASATNSQITMDEAVFLSRMQETIPGVFDFVDGWTSHSYPNPGFSGSETAKGKGTIATFEWELSFLKSLGVTRDLPVFITETGWVKTQKPNNEEKISHQLTYAFANVWNKPSIVAVTPFILNYPNYPFTGFSWKDRQGNFYQFFEAVRSLPKVKGEPVLPPEPVPVREFKPFFFGLAEVFYRIDTNQKMQTLSLFVKI